MAAQVREQYYSPAGRLVLTSNSAIRQAWDTAARAARDGLTAQLAPGSKAWARGVAHVAFATTVCPAWMLHQISALAGPLGSDGWNVIPAPGGAGNAGGFYLALPGAGRHQQAAFQLASFLAGEQAGVELFRSQGDFPANFAAVYRAGRRHQPVLQRRRRRQDLRRGRHPDTDHDPRPGQRRHRH